MNYKTELKTNYYHDLKRDEMVYDKDLYYDIYSFEGGDPLLDSKIGIGFARRVALYLCFGFFWSAEEHRYKTIKAAVGFAGQTESVDGFHVDANREQDDDDITLNGKHIGAAITIIRK